MTYASIMVQLLIGRSNSGLLKITADLANRFHAQVTGIGVCQPIPVTVGDGYGYISPDVIKKDRQAIENDMKDAESEFRRLLDGRKLSWRSITSYDPLPELLAREARCADLVVTGVNPDLASLDGSRHVEAGDLALRAGRPVLVVPSDIDGVSFRHIVIGWKDTRETRRAIVDALPFLKSARYVKIVEICSDKERDRVCTRLDDVVNWLGRHDVLAEANMISSSKTDDDASKLAEFVRDCGADLIVGGAYGHSRLREWVLGGVTRDLLLRADCCSLVSH